MIVAKFIAGALSVLLLPVFALLVALVGGLGGPFYVLGQYWTSPKLSTAERLGACSVMAAVVWYATTWSVKTWLKL